ncbi:MAG: hypothetical protein A2076_10770 [Geobacteraceae bacterium GWC2_53_11]|nr:MAG: hypothetical protein A2076_10770 [Geobacteraceae bacterium GWC2_53_11]
MDDELLSDILAAERDIRLQIEDLKRQTEERLEKLRQEIDQTLGDETRSLQHEREQALARAEQTARQEANAQLAEARAFAARLENLDTPELERVVIRHLSRILPGGADDRQDEQT